MGERRRHSRCFRGTTLGGCRFGAPPRRDSLCGGFTPGVACVGKRLRAPRASASDATVSECGIETSEWGRVSRVAWVARLGVWRGVDRGSGFAAHGRVPQQGKETPVLGATLQSGSRSAAGQLQRGPWPARWLGVVLSECWVTRETGKRRPAGPWAGAEWQRWNLRRTRHSGGGSACAGLGRGGRRPDARGRGRVAWCLADGHCARPNSRGGLTGHWAGRARASWPRCSARAWGSPRRGGAARCQR
jgi:hypothetical protein